MSSDAIILTSASTLAPQVDNAMLGLLIICGSMLLLVLGLIVFFGYRYRKDSAHSRALNQHESLWLEWGWTLASMAVFLAFFAFGVVIFFDMHIAPVGAAEIAVVGKQWMWKFQHPNGKREINELHVPVNQPIILNMISQDVIHSMFVPDFRLKQDVLPGRYTKTWFEASKAGEYRLFCTQYCGTMHAQMIGRVFVLSAKDYDQWLEGDTMPTTAPKSMATRGEKLFAALGCVSCHAEGKEELGPSLTGLFGSTVKLANGQLIRADEDYIRESILNPNAKIVAGYLPVMPSFQGKISEEDLHDVIAYIKSLGESQ